MEPVTYAPIGRIHSPFTDPVGMPIQSAAAQGVPGWLEIEPAFAPGLADLEGFDYVFLIYHLHLSGPGSLAVTPFLDTQPRGIFATRSPRRPNALGLSVVRLRQVGRARVDVEDVDVVDGTPLLDIKPYVPRFDVRAAERIGWFAGTIDRLDATRADDRFAPSA